MRLDRLKNWAPDRGAFLKEVPVTTETKDVIHFHSKMHENWIMQICFDLGKIELCPAAAAVWLLL